MIECKMPTLMTISSNLEREREGERDKERESVPDDQFDLLFCFIGYM